MTAENSLTVSRDAVVSLFVSIGFKGADKWDRVKISKKIDNLPKLVADMDITELPDDDSSLLDDILNAIQAGGSVEIEELEAEEAEVEEAPAPAKKAPKPAPKIGEKPAKPVKKAPTIAATVDRYGVSAEVLLSGPQTVEEAIAAANETYVEGGGKDNEREAAFALRNTLRALKHIGLVAQNGKDITVVGKVVPIKN